MAVTSLELAAAACQVDGTAEKVLVGRFHVEGFPTIFHIQGAETRQFVGHRTFQKVSCIASQ